MLFNQQKELQSIFAKYDAMEIPTLYHVTTESRANKILKEGLKTSFKGTNHEVDIQPQVPLVYLSKFPNSNNLPSILADSGERLVSLEINSNFIDKSSIYPDDGMFCAIGQEQFFYEIDDIMEDIGLSSEDEAKFIFDKTFELCNDTVEEWKCFAMWYLITEGEISTTQNIPAKHIAFSHYIDI